MQESVARRIQPDRVPPTPPQELREVRRKTVSAWEVTCGPAHARTEDYAEALPDGSVSVVADGMSNPPGGDVASREAARFVLQDLGGRKPATLGQAQELVRDAIMRASDHVRGIASMQGLREIGTTLEVVMQYQEKDGTRYAIIGHVGDSRTQVFDQLGKEKELDRVEDSFLGIVADEIEKEREFRRRHDQAYADLPKEFSSWVLGDHISLDALEAVRDTMVHRGASREHMHALDFVIADVVASDRDELVVGEYRNMLTQVVGGASGVEPHIIATRVKKGDTIVSRTDGVKLPPRDLAAVVTRLAPKDAAHLLVTKSQEKDDRAALITRVGD